MKVNGTIQIDSTAGTITIRLDNGSYCVEHYPIGIQRFLEVEIECLQDQERLDALMKPIFKKE